MGVPAWSIVYFWISFSPLFSKKMETGDWSRRRVILVLSAPPVVLELPWARSFPKGGLGKFIHEPVMDTGTAGGSSAGNYSQFTLLTPGCRNLAR